jgi:hypothetical protein
MMVLHAISSCAGESPFQEAQLTDVPELELLPPARRTASTVAADLKSEQALDAVPDPIVMRLDDSTTTGLVHELDETSVNNRAHELGVHDEIPDSLRSEGPCFRIAINPRR